jgi:glycosyltransferase involved in cell wall biosynthesis
MKSVLRALARVAPQHEVVVFVSRANRDLFEIGANVRLVECLSSNEHIPARILTQQLQYPVLLRRHGIDVLHALNQVPLATPRPTVVKVCTLHHYVTPDEFTQKIANPSAALANRLRLVYRRVTFDWSARRATLVMANSEATRDLIVQYMKVPRERVAIVYESVDDRFEPAADPESLRASLAARHGLRRPYVLYVSNLWFYKNADGAIRAFAEQCRRYHDDLDLVIVGNDDYRRLPDLQAIATAEGVSDRVRFLGRVKRDDLISLYQGAHVIFYPSFAETFGKPVVEGMRSGVPVVAARAGSLPELVGSAGLLVDPADPIEMAAALHAAAADHGLRARLIDAGLRRGVDFSWDRTAFGTLDLCARAVSMARPGPASSPVSTASS